MPLSKAKATNMIVSLILVILITLIFIAGLIRLLINWQYIDAQYGPGYPIGMLLVTLFVPFGGLWPLFVPVRRRYYEARMEKI